VDDRHLAQRCDGCGDHPSVTKTRVRLETHKGTPRLTYTYGKRRESSFLHLQMHKKGHLVTRPITICPVLLANFTRAA
jgi:hypothetical protein